MSSSSSSSSFIVYPLHIYLFVTQLRSSSSTSFILPTHYICNSRMFYTFFSEIIMENNSASNQCLLEMMMVRFILLYVIRVLFFLWLCFEHLQFFPSFLFRNFVS